MLYRSMTHFFREACYNRPCYKWFPLYSDNELDKTYSESEFNLEWPLKTSSWTRSVKIVYIK